MGRKPSKTPPASSWSTECDKTAVAFDEGREAKLVLSNGANELRGVNCSPRPSLTHQTRPFKLSDKYSATFGVRKTPVSQHHVELKLGDPRKTPRFIITISLGKGKNGSFMYNIIMIGRWKSYISERNKNGWLDLVQLPSKNIQSVINVTWGWFNSSSLNTLPFSGYGGILEPFNRSLDAIVTTHA